MLQHGSSKKLIVAEEKTLQLLSFHSIIGYLTEDSRIAKYGRKTQTKCSAVNLYWSPALGDYPYLD
jgi:hypothetical protein